ncbi:hypothetical protein [Aeoliella sp.]|uniref:hypothetical protein n=1 Tax=Aeoliella sp. TaxID=2795800 RepID=UPI003CCB850D
MAESIEGINENYEKTTKGAKQLERAAGRIVQANLTAQERYNQKMSELARLVKAGKLSMDEAEKAALRYRKQLDRAGESGRKAFGADMLGGLRSMATGYLSVQAAINAVTSAMSDLQAQEEAAAQRARASTAGLGELAQLAATAQDPKQAYADLLQEAREFRAAGAAESTEEAAGQLFSLVSAELERRDRDFAKKLRASGVMSEVGGASTAYSAMTTALGKGEVGSFEEMISKALAASSIAPALANEIVQASAQSGGSAAALGISDEFLLSATAILGKKTGTAAQGGTQLAALLKGIEERTGDEFKGKSGIEIIKELKGRDLDRAGIVGLVGNRAEAVEGLRTLIANSAQLEQLLSEVQSAASRGVARTALGLPDTDQVVRSGKTAKASAGMRDVVEQETLSQRTNLSKAATDQIVAAYLKEGNRAGAWFQELKSSWYQWAGDERLLLVEAARSGKLAAETQLEVLEYLRETTERDAGLLMSKDRIRAREEQFDRMIELLEAQLAATRQNRDTSSSTRGQ